MTFYSWLCQQAARTDAVGAAARHAIKDRVFPRDGRKLNLFLLRYEGLPEQRAHIKAAHAEWRRTRRALAA